MADREEVRSCNIVLHDDRISEKDVLGGAQVLPLGTFAYLSSNGASEVLVCAAGPARSPNDISIHVKLGVRLGFINRTEGKLRYARKETKLVADHVDILLHDQILSRADLWHLTRQLHKDVLYKGADICYLSSVAASVQHIYQAGNEVQSALHHDGETKAIVRTGNAHYTILVQVSTEMLEDWTDGDLMFERMLSDFLPELFRRWEASKVRHSFSVILFGRARDTPDTWKDFYMTVCTDASWRSWRDIVLTIKHMFNSLEVPHKVTPAAHGNLVEAINLTVASFVSVTEAISISGTGSTIIVITAGSGLFETRHGLLYNTTQALLGNSIGVDIVSLAQKPSHPVPLFAYTFDGKHEYALPHWADISYYSPVPQSDAAIQGDVPRVASVLDEVKLPNLTDLATEDISSMAAYDSDVFAATPALAFAKKQPSMEALQIREAEQGKEVTTSRLTTPKLKQHPSSSSIATTLSLSRASKNRHTSLLSNRKISMGPRGLAPVTSMANATISAAHAKHDREMLSAITLGVQEHESSITKQIRATLRKRSSQSSITSHGTDVGGAATNVRDIDAVAVRKPAASVEREATTLARSQDSSRVHSLKSGSHSLRAFDNLASSPRQFSIDPVTTATTPWLTLFNPCNLKKDNMRIAEQYRQWQHIFPKSIESVEFKWTSLCSPAVLPLHQNLRPSRADLKAYYSRSTRRLICAKPDGNSKGADYLMKRLMALRLVHGFQIVASDVRNNDQEVFMSIGAHYHELKCLSEVELEIVEYKYTSGRLPAHGTTCLAEVKTPHSAEPVEITATLAGGTAEADWARLDQQMLSNELYSALSRMRLVLIPIEVSKGSDKDLIGKELADDERRIEGIQRLTQQWQRYRILSAEEQSHQVSVTRKRNARSTAQVDPNPLAIEYHTRDPSTLVNAQEGNLLQNTTRSVHQPPLFAESEMFHTSNFDIFKLARQMQEPPPQGVEMRDRRWFARVHLQCFRGDEMTNWLLGAFKDLSTREEAVEMGNELQERGVFTHVRHKHAFMDGNYFYQIAATYRTTDHPSAIASVFGRVSHRSVPPTPSTEVRLSPQVHPARAGHESSEQHSLQIVPTEKKQVMLSQMLTCNVDPAGKSAYDEAVNVHYDRIHNPENCYHIYLDWCLTTPLLVREAITRWSNLVESYGLKLMRVPMLEATKYCELHPFEQPAYMRLSLAPPDRVPATPMLGPAGGSPRSFQDPVYYHKAILRELGFVLDLESRDAFSTKLDVQVTWGRMDFSMTQFIHKSGLILAQIGKRQPWDFLFLPNSLAYDHGHGTPSRSASSDTTSTILQNARKLLRDTKALRALYEVAARPKAPAPSPFARAALANLDADVPPIQLPPHLLHRGLA